MVADDGFQMMFVVNEYGEVAAVWDQKAGGGLVGARSSSVPVAAQTVVVRNLVFAHRCPHLQMRSKMRQA